MARLFNISPWSSLAHVFGNGIIFDSFLKGIVAIDSKEVYWPQMIAFYLYAQFRLVSPSGNCDFKIIQILNQVESILNLIPIILAETFIGLDNLPVTHCFTRSPILLEVISMVSLQWSKRHVSLPNRGMRLSSEEACALP